MRSDTHARLSICPIVADPDATITDALVPSIGERTLEDWVAIKRSQRMANERRRANANLVCPVDDSSGAVPNAQDSSVGERTFADWIAIRCPQRMANENVVCPVDDGSGAVPNAQNTATDGGSTVIAMAETPVRQPLAIAQAPPASMPAASYSFNALTELRRRGAAAAAHFAPSASPSRPSAAEQVAGGIAQYEKRIREINSWAKDRGSFFKFIANIASMIDKRIGLERMMLLAVTWYSLGPARRQSLINAMRVLFARWRDASTFLVHVARSPMSLLPPAVRLALAHAKYAYAGATIAAIKILSAVSARHDSRRLGAALPTVPEESASVASSFLGRILCITESDHTIADVLNRASGFIPCLEPIVEHLYEREYQSWCERCSQPAIGCDCTACERCGKYDDGFDDLDRCVCDAHGLDLADAFVQMPLQGGVRVNAQLPDGVQQNVPNDAQSMTFRMLECLEQGGSCINDPYLRSARRAIESYADSLAAGRIRSPSSIMIGTHTVPSEQGGQYPTQHVLTRGGRLL